MTNSGSRLEATNMTKCYGNVIANNNVNFSIKSGEIKALLGENGAGKSTLVKMLCGIVRPDRGDILWKGKPAIMKNPKVAKRHGIGMVFQHFSLFDNLSVVENIGLSLEGRYDKGLLLKEITDISEHYGLPIDPNKIVANLSVGAKQRIEIIRCLMQNPQLLILDEPTAVLTPQEAEKLFTTLNALSEEGCSILYISHRLDEVRRLCHSATIMRAGEVVGDIVPAKNTAKEIAELMLGEQILKPKHDANKSFEQQVLSVNKLCLEACVNIGRGPLKNINLQLHKGEIFGIAGIAGNGQNELMSVLSGEIKMVDANLIELDEEPIAHRGIAARRAKGLGVAYVPEERLGHGAVAEMSLADNVLLTANKSQQIIRHGWIDKQRAISHADQIIKDFRVKADGSGSLANELSGGNLQKFIVGREITQAPKVILAAQPTWGVDAGAASQIQQTLINLANEGCAVILISQDLDEIFTVANRVAIMFEGTLSDAYLTSEITLDEIGLLMVGEPIKANINNSSDEVN
ncbi:MAG: ABC transporter ATP-binding protein [Gammaproteobacteria bacterium]|nr:ABC transporter ATP-binding protein [Gammaproteobacteria bacterium]